LNHIGSGKSLNGGSWYIELSGGRWERRANGIVGKGVAGGIAFGMIISGTFEVFVPLMYHSMQSGLPKRIQVTSLPYLGFNFDL